MPTLRILALYIAFDEEIRTFTYIVKKRQDSKRFRGRMSCQKASMYRLANLVIGHFNGKRASPDSQGISTKKKRPQTTTLLKFANFYFGVVGRI